VQGGDALAASLKRAADELRDLSDAHQRAGNALQQAAQTRAPRRTGRLARGIHAAVTSTGVTVGADVAYAWPIHSGVPGRIVAHPFLTDALAAEQTAVLDVYTDAVTDAVGIVRT